MDSDEEEDDEFMDDDDDEKPDITPVENDSKIREIIDKICDLEDQQDTVICPLRSNLPTCLTCPHSRIERRRAS